MYDIEPMKKGEIEVVFEEGSDRFPSVLLVSTLPDYGSSEILVEYVCESEDHVFIRWSACIEDPDRDFFSHNCSFCGATQRECLMMDVCEFDSNPFNSSVDSQELVFRDSGVTSVCKYCFEDAEGLVNDAAIENESEFVAFNI